MPTAVRAGSGLHRRAVVRLCAAAAGLASGLIPTGGHGQDDASGVVDAVVRQVNAVRAASGIGRLALDTRLVAAAQRHADSMAATGSLSHIGAAGDTLDDRLQDAGYAFVTAAENLGAGQPTAEALVADWMDSAGNRSNLLTPGATQIGVGHALRPDDPYRHYWTVVLAAPARSAEEATGGLTGVVSGVLAEVNRQRQSHFLPAVTLSSFLADAAQLHSDSMAHRNTVTHDGPNGSSVADRVVAAGYRYRYVAENVAGGQRNPAEVVYAWMNSPGHRANILSTDVIEVGVGYRFRADGELRHFWTLVLASPR